MICALSLLRLQHVGSLHGAGYKQGSSAVGQERNMNEDSSVPKRHDLFAASALVDEIWIHRDPRLVPAAAAIRSLIGAEIKTRFVPELPAMLPYPVRVMILYSAGTAPNQDWILALERLGYFPMGIGVDPAKLGAVEAKLPKPTWIPFQLTSPLEWSGRSSSDYLASCFSLFTNHYPDSIARQLFGFAAFGAPDELLVERAICAIGSDELLNTRVQDLSRNWKDCRSELLALTTLDCAMRGVTHFYPEMLPYLAGVY